MAEQLEWDVTDPEDLSWDITDPEDLFWDITDPGDLSYDAPEGFYLGDNSYVDDERNSFLTE